MQLKAKELKKNPMKIIIVGVITKIKNSNGIKLTNLRNYLNKLNNVRWRDEVKKKPINY